MKAVPALQQRRLIAALVLLYNGALLAWLLLRPGTPALVAAVDNVAQFVGPLVMVPLCFGGLRGLWHRTAQDRVPFWLGCGVLSDGIAQVIWTYYQQILHQSPFPSWADAAYLSTYPFLLLGILYIPARPLSAAARFRVITDGLVVMTGIVTFSWYFILGPTFLQGGETLLAKVLGTAYPVWDLVLVFCLFLLSVRSTEANMRLPVRLLGLGLLCYVVADCVFDYQSLQGTYATGELIDVGWPLADMLIALAAYTMRLALAQHGRDGQSAADLAPLAAATTRRTLWAWRTFLPYALVPAVGALLVYAWQTHGEKALQLGVYWGGSILVGLVLLRQVLALLENRRLNDELVASNQALREANARLEAMAITDPLTGLLNHRAMVAVIDQELERGHRYSRPCAVLCLDLDHFKALNDGHGHAAGDAALRELATVLRAALRGVDIIGRWGGEELIVLLPETAGEAALVIAEHLRAAVAAHVFAAGGGMHVTCSIGVAAYPHDATQRAALLEAADHAMYAAKRLGRNQARAVADPAVTVFLAGASADGSREESALVGTVEALASLVEARDRYTGQHMQEVAALAMRVGVAMGLDAAETPMVGVVARLHDVGKVAVPDAVLQKAARLSDEEWALMRTHPAVGADVVSRVPMLRALAPAIRAHHERWDGTGYPDGLAGTTIPLAARIVAVVDAYGAMTTARPYRQACTEEWARAELARCAGTQFDPAVVAALEYVLAEASRSPQHTQGIAWPAAHPQYFRAIEAGLRLPEHELSA